MNTGTSYKWKTICSLIDTDQTYTLVFFKTKHPNHMVLSFWLHRNNMLTNPQQLGVFVGGSKKHSASRD